MHVPSSTGNGIGAALLCFPLPSYPEKTLWTRSQVVDPGSGTALVLPMSGFMILRHTLCIPGCHEGSPAAGGGTVARSSGGDHDFAIRPMSETATLPLQRRG